MNKKKLNCQQNIKIPKNIRKLNNIELSALYLKIYEQCYKEAQNNEYNYVDFLIYDLVCDELQIRMLKTIDGTLSNHYFNDINTFACQIVYDYLNNSNKKIYRK